MLPPKTEAAELMVGRPSQISTQNPGRDSVARYWGRSHSASQTRRAKFVEAKRSAHNSGINPQTKGKGHHVAATTSVGCSQRYMYQGER
jgi:hypothetical protein